MFDEDLPLALNQVENQFLVKQYFQQYKQTIKNFSLIDQVLKQKIHGKIKPSKRYFDQRNKTINPKL